MSGEIHERLPKINRHPRSSDLTVCPVAPIAWRQLTPPESDGSTRHNSTAVHAPSKLGKDEIQFARKHEVDSRVRIPCASFGPRRDAAIVRAQISDRSRDIRWLDQFSCFAYLKFAFAKSQLTRFHHASTYLGRALR
jgi:hypothetical protein